MENIYRIANMQKDERPREILLEKGEKVLSNSQLLAILLNSGTKEKSAIQLAADIIDAAGGLKNLNGMSVEQLSDFKGIGVSKACKIIAALELGIRVSQEKGKENFNISSPQDISNIFMEELRYKKVEIFRIAMVNTKNVIIGMKDISQGSLNASIVHPREVFLEAIKKSANKIILVHNHPSGDPNPSPEDFSITRRLIEAGKIIGIEVLDHIIIGDGVFYSFKEHSKM